MTNAPLVYTVTQVRFNHVLNLEKFLANIQDQFRTAGFPDFRHETVNTFIQPVSGSSSATPQFQLLTRYAFANVDGTEGFILENNGFAFQATDYINFEDFLSKFINGLVIVNNAMNLSYYERIGLRYLDAVIPKHGESLADYIKPNLLGFQVSGKLRHSYAETLSDNEFGGLIARLLIQNGKISLPNELSATPAAALFLNEKFTKAEGLHALIDTDAFSDSRKVFDMDAISSALNTLHKEVVKAFKDAVTEHALKVWG